MSPTGGRPPARERSPEAGRWRAIAVLAALGLALAPLGWLQPGNGPPATAEREVGVAEVRAALRDGNRKARVGDPEGALTAWAAGWSGAVGGEEAALAYNLATTAHRLGRRPEALLWYRRAERAGAGDAWLVENLTLVRAELGAPRLLAPGALGWLASRPGLLPAIAAFLAWLAAGLAAAAFLRTGRNASPGSSARPTGSRSTITVLRRAGLGVGAAALAAWAGGVAVASGAPRPAVLVAACPSASGELPAGSEVWVEPGEDGGWRIAGGPPGSSCPPEVVGLVE